MECINRDATRAGTLRQTSQVDIRSGGHFVVENTTFMMCDTILTQLQPCSALVDCAFFAPILMLSASFKSMIPT